MIRVGFIGVPGAGKTTTARAVAGAVRMHTKFSTIELVDEYARRFIAKYGIPSVYDQMRILNKQLTQEDKFPESTQLLVTDSPIFLGLGYAMENREPGNGKHTMIINDLFKDMNKLNEIPRYDIIFHIPPKVEPVKDGIRPEHQFDPAWRQKMDLKLLSLFYVFPPHKLITIQSTSTNERVLEAMQYIRELEPK
jgi:deoxyadenosine/deoxycytidine kinase